MRDLDAADVALFVEQVETPVGEGRDREPRDARHRLRRESSDSASTAVASARRPLPFLLETKLLERHLELAPARRDLEREGLEISALTRALPHEDIARPLRIEETLHPRAQLARKEGLHDVVLGPSLQELHPKIFVGLGGQQHDRNRIELMAGSDLSQQRVAAHDRHHDVADDDVRRAVERAREPLASVARGDEPVSLPRDSE